MNIEGIKLKISLKGFLAKYEDFLSSQYAPKEQIKEFIKDFEELDEKEELPDDVIQRVEACKEILEK